MISSKQQHKQWQPLSGTNCSAAVHHYKHAAAVAGKDYNYEDDYLKQTYDSYGYQGEEEASKPKCGPKQFDELKEATTCIDVDSGACGWVWGVGVHET